MGRLSFLWVEKLDLWYRGQASCEHIMVQRYMGSARSLLHDHGCPMPPQIELTADGIE